MLVVIPSLSTAIVLTKTALCERGSDLLKTQLYGDMSRERSS